jgi:hypothetical protein
MCDSAYSPYGGTISAFENREGAKRLLAKY